MHQRHDSSKSIESNLVTARNAKQLLLSLMSITFYSAAFGNFLRFTDPCETISCQSKCTQRTTRLQAGFIHMLQIFLEYLHSVVEEVS